MAKAKHTWHPGHKKVLLLSANYEVLNFITDLRAILMFLKDRAEVLASWDEKYPTSSTPIQIPSVLRLKKLHRRKNGPVRYHRVVVFRRDGWTCQYCARPVSRRDATIDHVVPQSQGGMTNYRNCVTACRPCNHRKAFKTPEEAGMALRKRPENPNILHVYNVDPDDGWHRGWDDYIGYLRDEKKERDL